MRTQSAKIVLLMVCLAVCVGTCRPWGDDVVEDAKTTAGNVKDGATAAVNDAGEKSESFAQWAYEKFHERFGSKEDDGKEIVQNAKYQVEDTASKATDSVKNAASGAYDEAKKQTDKASGVVGHKANVAKDKVGEAYDSTKKTVTGETKTK